MQLRELLRREHILVPLEASTLQDALAKLIDVLLEEGEITDASATERLSTETGLRDIIVANEHVVLPHFRTESVERLVVAVGITREPLRARAAGLDIRPRIIVLILAPAEAVTLYLQSTSALARLLRQPKVTEQLLRAQTPDDVLQLAELRELRIQPRLTVRDIMAHRVDSVTPDTPLEAAVERMIRHRGRAIPVVGEKGEVLGIISEWDVIRALLPNIPRAGDTETEEEDVIIPDTMKVRDVMTRSVLCISEDLGVDEVANTMVNKDVEQFPVVSEGKLAGFLTRGDIIRKIFGR